MADDNQQSGDEGKFSAVEQNTFDQEYYITNNPDLLNSGGMEAASEFAQKFDIGFRAKVPETGDLRLHADAERLE